MATLLRKLSGENKRRKMFTLQTIIWGGTFFDFAKSIWSISGHIECHMTNNKLTEHLCYTYFPIFGSRFSDCQGHSVTLIPLHVSYVRCCKQIIKRANASRTFDAKRSITWIILTVTQFGLRTNNHLFNSIRNYPSKLENHERK